MFDTSRTLSDHHLDLIRADIDAELALIYGDDGEPSDTVLFDLLDSDPDPCHHPGGHVWVGKCGETRCLYCSRIVG
jgi:hypothetical protein